VGPGSGAAAPIARTTPKTTPKTTPRVAIKVTPPPPPDKPRGAVTAKAVAAAEKKAETLYRARKFSDAAATLRAVIEEIDDPATAKRLKAEAASYESIGTNIASGSSGDATVAYAALTRALATDRKIGDAHQSFIRDRLVPVAPKAAATFLARGKFEEAKRAADTAVNVGAGGTPTVQQVRSTLENKASAMYTAAAKIFKKKPEDAKAQLRRVMAMVPNDSQWYSKASRLLKGGDDDE
jgi:tetratricopeptide (TPR) repeat protein